MLAGQIDGFYKRSRDGELHVERALLDSPVSNLEVDLFKLEGRITSGYPQPETIAGYTKAVYSESCPRCGIYGRQKAPFRFEKSVRGPLKGFMRLNWVPGVFFVARDIADEITRAGITGISFGPAVAGRSAEELPDRVQMLVPTLVACAETSKLPPVTCRPKNEEAVAINAMLQRRQQHRSKTTSELSPSLREHFGKLKEKMAKIPFCGGVKHHSPTSLALIPNSTAGVPDVFQTAEWFGSGACAFRLTLASRRFADLVRDRGWKGLEFREVRQEGFSERE